MSDFDLNLVTASALPSIQDVQELHALSPPSVALDIILNEHHLVLNTDKSNTTEHNHQLSGGWAPIVMAWVSGSRYRQHMAHAIIAPFFGSGPYSKHCNRWSLRDV